MFVNASALPMFLHNKINRNQTDLQKSLQRISKGMRISSASDDAAGLAISQKMLALAKGSRQAIRNVQDAISLVQVADGAMDEMSTMVQRMRELSVKAANATNTAADRNIMQDEINQLKKELHNIVVNTKFNTINLLSNKEVDTYSYENRLASKTSQLTSDSIDSPVHAQRNHLGYNQLNYHFHTRTISFSTEPLQVNRVNRESIAVVGSTVIEHLPRWSSDGQWIVFNSTRDGGQYALPADLSERDPQVKPPGVTTVAPTRISSNELMRLRVSGSTLLLETRVSLEEDWETLREYSDYNYNRDFHNGFAFSPVVDEEGNTSFVYSDSNGNLKKVDVNINSRSVTQEAYDIIPNSDRLHLPPLHNTITLSTRPDLYRMNSSTASLRIYKVNDEGARELLYWDGTGAEPLAGYYTVSNNAITFHNDAIIGAEEIDDAQDFYRFFYVGDGTQNDVYTVSIPSNAEIYNMHGQEGPRSLKIEVGNTTVSRDQLLAERPADPEGTTGVFVDAQNNRVEFYGDLRPAYHQDVSISYFTDTDGQNGVPTFTLFSNIDTYNLDDSDLSSNRSLRVFIKETEISLVSEQNHENSGFYYDQASGRIHFYGDARPDLHDDDPTVRIRYVRDYSSSNTTSEVYGLPLNSTHRPEIYNLDNEETPKSIRVFRNITEEIPYSNVDGFQYNQSTNTIEFYGTSRPNTGDSYRVFFVQATGGLSQDELVEIPLTHRPETYGITDPTNPSTFRVLVDNQEVYYDETKQNGFFYNSQTNRIELYGSARPDANPSFTPDVRVYYAYESPAVIVGNDSYDFRLQPTTLHYGVDDSSEPRALRVYYQGTEVPYDPDQGFTYNPDTNLLSLHGEFRPNAQDNAGDYWVYSIQESALQRSIPQNAQIYKVIVNGSEIEEASSAAGDGYYYNGQLVQIVGQARPNIMNTTNQVRLEVKYYDSIDIELDNSKPLHLYYNYCFSENDSYGTLEIDPEQLVVRLNGVLLEPEQFSLQGSQIVLDREKVALTLGSNRIDVEYRVRHIESYKPNEFTFQVGAQTGQSLHLAISSFEEMLQHTDAVCVLTPEYASQAIPYADRALQFISEERGKIGATQNRLEAISSFLTVTEENTRTSLSRIQDADIARETINLVRLKILSDAQLVMVTHVQDAHEGILALLR
ncbi:flagellin [Heliorestis convoluta]|uniref:Flagellin n=1 Tax=Heliorestis convoluta TaxID=356322 RepID=A0A5Q2MY07_9FIRM|nr:flagellin [Heliorestis convoluta]QGG47497.1 bacterial flagellin C-terminal helical region family protein [Heliorestis convoluta]